VQRASHAHFYAPIRWTERKRVFVCELSDFMHRGADDWRSMACGVMAAAPWHDYLILSKRPERFNDWYIDSVWDDWWLGATTENQEQFESRAERLLTLRHSRLWISAEPLLGPIDFGDKLVATDYLPHIAWVVVGAESGPNRRPCHIEWIEHVVAQCRAANVPVFVKQGSHCFPGQQGDIPDHLWQIKEIPQ
jgi:protein gp37